ncbi:MAG: hypothetical protein N2043_05940 [Ignavibacterium sp.]|nr:hypothetical protein [Ignavibacterium sp.]
MKINLDKIHYRIKTDLKFKKKFRRLILLVGSFVIFIALIGIVALIFLSSSIVSFLFANVPCLLEFGFNFARSFLSSFMLEDIIALLMPLSGETNANEMQNLVKQYFNQLSSIPTIDFQDFQNFIATVKNSVLDQQITNSELELIRQFILN